MWCDIAALSHRVGLLEQELWHTNQRIDETNQAFNRADSWILNELNFLRNGFQPAIQKLEEEKAVQDRLIRETQDALLDKVSFAELDRFVQQKDDKIMEQWIDLTNEMQQLREQFKLQSAKFQQSEKELQRKADQLFAKDFLSNDAMDRMETAIASSVSKEHLKQTHGDLQTWMTEQFDALKDGVMTTEQQLRQLEEQLGNALEEIDGRLKPQEMKKIQELQSVRSSKIKQMHGELQTSMTDEAETPQSFSTLEPSSPESEDTRASDTCSKFAKWEEYASKMAKLREELRNEIRTVREESSKASGDFYGAKSDLAAALADLASCRNEVEELRDELGGTLLKCLKFVNKRLVKLENQTSLERLKLVVGLKIGGVADSVKSDDESDESDERESEKGDEESEQEFDRGIAQKVVGVIGTADVEQPCSNGVDSLFNHHRSRWSK
eukprot:Skav232736  [mRNA]  locus=scaffold1843:175828:177147:- [translate_table: standard]